MPVFTACRLSVVVASVFYSYVNARTCHCSGLSFAEHRLWGAQTQQLWHMSLAVPWHVASSQTRGQTHVSDVGRQMGHRGSPLILPNDPVTFPHSACLSCTLTQERDRLR